MRDHETEVRRCLQKGAHKVQIDFTEGRLSMKVDPSVALLSSFIDLNNLAISRFSPEERDRTTSRETAFAKLTARVRGTALAAQILGVG